MNIAILGKGLYAKTSSAVLAAEGHMIFHLCKDENIEEFENEPGLSSLYEQQISAGMISFKGSKKSVGIVFDFVLIAEFITISDVEILFKSQIKQAFNGTCFILLAPSEIGETEHITKLIIEHSIKAVVACIPLLIREGVALEDFSRPKLLVIGCDKTATIGRLKVLFQPFTFGENILNFVSPKEAEFSSFAGKAMLATRLSFMNEMASLAEKLQIDIEVVRECIGSDPRIGSEYLYPGCGYGGEALQINVDKVAKKLKKRNDDLGLLDIVTRINQRQKDILFRKIWKYFNGNLSDKTIAIWGASFKPNSESLSGAPAISLIDSLLAQDAKVNVYDPLANKQLMMKYQKSDSLQVKNSRDEVLVGSDLLVICTEWEEFFTPDFNLIKKELNYPAIFDGRNLYQPDELKQIGIQYFAIGRGENI